jgi:hypothetical protein
MTHSEIFSESKCEDLPSGAIVPRLGVLQATRIALAKPLEVTETADPIEAWKPIRGTGVRRARVPRMGISKTTMRDVLVIVHKALPPEQRDQTKPRP